MRLLRKAFLNLLSSHNLFMTVPLWYHFILQRDKDRIVKFLKYTKKVLHLDYQNMKLTVNAAAKAEFIRMATKFMMISVTPYMPL